MSGIELYIVTVIVFIIGLALGYLLGRPKKVGSFTINYTDPQKDLCQLELTSDLDVIDKLKRMELDVKVINENGR